MTASTIWQERARGLAATLVSAGVLSDPAWREAFERTPRHIFTPRFWALDEYNAPARLVDGADPAQQQEWLDTVYSDRFLATHWVNHGNARMITSSASQPSLVARMLALLEIHDGMRVLEIGTGTGYNTSLLCRRLNNESVASVDIDRVLIAEATENLACVGHQPLLRTGDGALGLKQEARYDRILSTCASPGVPAAWIDQLSDDGVIVAPFTVGGALAVLRKTGPDEVTGFLDSEQAWFMPLHAYGEPVPYGYLIDLPESDPWNGLQYRGTADIDPAAFADPDFRLWLTLHLPADARVVDLVNDDLVRTGVVIHTAENRADACFPVDDVSTWVVNQDERRLFDTVEAAWRAWLRNGCPQRQRIGITARCDGSQTAWLDSPQSSAFTCPLPVS